MDRLEELALLVAIVEEGSLAAAGRRTRRSPASVTRILGDLERRLGLRLVERTTRRLAVTDAGRVLGEHARALLAHYEEAIGATTGRSAIARGTLRVSAPLVFGRMHLAPVVAGFLEAYRDVTVELFLSNRLVDLVEERIDVALRIGPLPGSPLVAKRVGEVKRVLVASPRYLQRHGHPRNLHDLGDHQFVVQLQGDLIPEWRFATPGGKSFAFSPKSRFMVNQAETAIDAACAGTGIIRALSYQVAGLISSRKLLRLLTQLEPPPLPVNLVYKERAFLPAQVRAFVDYAAPALARRMSSRHRGKVIVTGRAPY